MTEGEFEKKIEEYRPGLYRDATSITRNRKMGQELVGELLVDLCEADKETGLPKYHKWDGRYRWLKTRLKWKAGEVWGQERIESGSALSLTVTTHTDYEEDWQADVYEAGLESGELPPGEEGVQMEIESYIPAGVSSSWSDSEVYSDPARGVFYGKKWNELDEDARPRAECPNVRLVDCPRCGRRTRLYTHHDHDNDLLHSLGNLSPRFVEDLPLLRELSLRRPCGTEITESCTTRARKRLPGGRLTEKVYTFTSGQVCPGCGLSLPRDVVPFSEKPWLWVLEHHHIMEHAKHKWLSGDAAEERAILYLDRHHELPPQIQRNEALHSLREAMKQAWEEALSNLEAEGGRIVRDTVLHRVALDYRIWELRDLDVMQGEGKTWEEISQLPEWGKIHARQVQYEVEPHVERFKQEWKRLRCRAYLQCRRQLKNKANTS